ncbi:MAG: hypothetical protein E7522_10910 [Ruminococcaceae bacterium]|nr:hypothetical protein [Oscillospiraceae bacterium]
MKKYFKIIIPIVCVVFVITAVTLLVVYKKDIWGNGIDNVNTNIYGEVKPDTWTAVDGLGRTLPTYEEVGGKKQEKFVGMFYWTWHYHHAQNRPARNASELLLLNPEAVRDFDHPIWTDGGDGVPYYWNEPLFGYYSNLDEYVVRKHAEMIADAGVDVIIFDCTNGSETWNNGYETLFKVFSEATEEGVNVPQIAFMLPFSDSEDANISLHNLYNNIYSKSRYKDLWFIWDNKPLIMAHKGSLDSSKVDEKEILDFFAFRENEPAYFTDDKFMSEEKWGWCSDYPQAKFGKTLFDGIEQMCVSVAQNAADGELVAMNSGKNVQGRSFTKDGYSYSYKKGDEIITVDSSTENSLLYGLNFQQQWDYAIECDPEFIFVTGWNEWLAGRWSEWQGTENAFPDQFSDEYSRDIEPANSILKDHYYYQLVSNIRRFKGMDENSIKKTGGTTIDILGNDSQWDSVANEYKHYVNSTRKRNADSWEGTHYENNTMRNDFKNVKVTYDDTKIYFRIETVDNVTSYKDNAWMRVFIDTDGSGKLPSWEGFEYVINRENATENEVIVEKSTGDWNFEKTGVGKYRLDKNIMYIEIPRSALDLDTEEEINFNFKLSDNMQVDGDILDFYKNGDVAPGGRFMFVF